MPVARVNDVEVYYEWSGSGPRTLFLNGSGATVDGSHLLLGIFAERCDLLAFDQRGIGRSPLPPAPYSMADLAADALALCDEIGWDTFAVTGISFGGMVAQELACTAPERVERLALLCTSPGGAFASYPLHLLRGLDPDEAARIGVEIMDTRFTPEWLATHPTDRGLVAMTRARPTAEADAAIGEELQLAARAAHDVVDRLGRVTCPTLVAAGRYDGIAPLANSELLAALIPASELRVYEGGHAFIAQDRTAFPEILHFLSSR